jgi:DNA-binding LacI/PurR family transcriptional regulator
MFPYQSIAAELRRRRQSGEYSSGKLPSERDLASEFSAHRNTVRRALDELEEGGVIRRDKTGRRWATSVRGGGVLAFFVRRHENWAAPPIILQGVEKIAQEHGFRAHWFDGNNSFIHAKEPLPSAELMRAHGIEAALIWANMPYDVSLFRSLRQAMPIVMMDRRVPGIETDFVGFDNLGAGRAITKHLLSQGRRKIGFVDDDPFLQPHQERMKGYFAAMGEAGLVRCSDWLFHCDGIMTESEMLKQYLLLNKNKVDAIICANDIVAAEIMVVMRGLGIQIPGDIAVTGFGNMLSPILDALDLTTMAQPHERIGEEASKLALSRIDGDCGQAIREIELPMKLIVRGSSG